MTVYFGCDIPEDLYFDVERDVWVRFEDNGLLTLGMTDPAQTRCGKLVDLRFKKVGTIVAQGGIAVTIESAKWIGPFPMPITGRIVETNETGFNQDILLLNKDPYGAGWLVKIDPTDIEAERDHLLKGNDALEFYKKRIDEQEIRCFRCAD